MTHYAFWLRAGIVHIAIERATGKRVAVKTVHKTNGQGEVDQEAELLAKVKGHPNVVELRGLYTDQWDTHVVTDLCSGGELFDHIIQRHPEGFTEAACSVIFRQVIAAVQHCHNHGVCHRDLKPENLLLFRDTQDSTRTSIKLIDFGLAHDMDVDGREMTESVGSPAYVAPEVFACGALDAKPGTSYGPACDLWSCGVLLYIFLKGRFPFASKADALSANIEDPTVGEASPEAQALVHGLLCLDPATRLTTEQVLCHQWMTKPPNRMLQHTLRGLEKFSAAMSVRRVVRGAIAKQLIARNRDPKQMTTEVKEEFRLLEKGFQKADIDGDGTMSLEEFVKLLRKMGYRLEECQLKTLFELVDDDHSGSVDVREFIGMCLSRSMMMNNNVLHRVFAKIAATDKGTTDLTEESLRQYLPGLPSQKVHTLYESMDLNSDGAVTFEEFRRALLDPEQQIQELDDAQFFSARQAFRGMLRLSTGVW